MNRRTAILGVILAAVPFGKAKAASAKKAPRKAEDVIADLRRRKVWFDWHFLWNHEDDGGHIFQGSVLYYGPDRRVFVNGRTCEERASILFDHRQMEIVQG